MKKTMLWIVGIILLATVVVAPPPFDSSLEFDTSLTIYMHYQYYYKQNTDHIFRFQVLNTTDGIILTNTTVNCSFNLMDDQGAVLYTQSAVGYTAPSWFVSLNANNFSTIGHYAFGIQCVKTDGAYGGIKPTQYEITGSGRDEGDEGDKKIAFILGAGLMAFLLLYFAFHLEEIHFLLKLMLIFFSLSLLILIPAAIRGYVPNLIGTFMKIPLWLFVFFMIYFTVFLFYDWAKKSERFVRAINSFKRR